MVKTRRIITNSDLDALVSCVLLKRVEPVGSVKFLPHERLRDGRFRATSEDIVVNMPYIQGCRIWFDHHDTNSVPDAFEGRYDAEAPSAARVVYEYYRDRNQEDAFEGLGPLLEATDKVDSARFSVEDIEEPEGAVLLSFLIDGHPLEDESVDFNLLIISLLDSGDPQRALDHPVIQPEKRAFLQNFEKSKEALSRHLDVDDGLLILDFRSVPEDERHLCENKFLPYVLYPESHTLLRVKDLNDGTLKVTLGFNMFLSSDLCPLHYGELCKRFGGGGHRRAAGCSLREAEADRALHEIRKTVLKAASSSS